MMSKKDFELVAQVIYNLPPNRASNIPHVSDGNQRRHIAVAFAKAFEARYPLFDSERFLDRACHNI